MAIIWWTRGAYAWGSWCTWVWYYRLVGIIETTDGGYRGITFAPMALFDWGYRGIEKEKKKYYILVQELEPRESIKQK